MTSIPARDLKPVHHHKRIRTPDGREYVLLSTAKNATKVLCAVGVPGEAAKAITLTPDTIVEVVE